jgi:hypothetical protein
VLQLGYVVPHPWHGVPPARRTTWGKQTGEGRAVSLTISRNYTAVPIGLCLCCRPSESAWIIAFGAFTVTHQLKTRGWMDVPITAPMPEQL